jgi:arabinosyltransferase C
MMFTPTKWTHHFGCSPGWPAAGTLAAVAVTAHVLRSRRNRAVFAALVLFVTALSFASVNGWWYVSNFGVPWSNQFPEWHFGFTTMLLGLTVVTLVVAAWFHSPGAPRPAGPVAVVVEGGRLAAGRRGLAAGVLRGAVADAGDDRPVPGVVGGPVQPAGAHRQDLRAGRRRDGRAGPNRAAHPDRRTVGDALGSATADGFTPNGIPSDVSADR